MTQPFDPNAPAMAQSGIFGLDSSPAAASIHLIPVPFDATTSFRKGAARGPEAVLAASHQVELFDLLTGAPYEGGIWMAPIDERVRSWNDEATGHALPVSEGAEDAAAIAEVNRIQEALNDWVHERVAEGIDAGKLVGIVGGDHSVSFGAIRAHSQTSPGLGILHIDAHADLRKAYQGFTHSHASILRNVIEKLDGVAKVVQVGIRDLCEEEFDFIRSSHGRIETLFDPQWAAWRLAGKNLNELVQERLKSLPDEVYVTVDIDGLDPSLCPNTGTPVPGGLSWHETMLWLSELVRSGRRILGFDLNEVAPAPNGVAGEGLDEIVGARLLYRLVGFAQHSRSL